jgi:predicted DsbA family dithiol-disulfide isomerase
MLIELFADFTCPWCFIGRRRLARACAQRPDLPIQIVWQPFQLNPELAPEGMDRAAYLRAKFSEPDRVRAMQGALEESGRKEGIRFAFDRIPRVPNTMDAHRLMRFATGSRREEQLAERLFSAHFELGEDIGSAEVLVECARSAGLDPTAAKDFLASGAERDAIAQMDELSRQGGIAGVPYFVFDRRYALAGAQEPAAFLPLFDALAADEPEMLASRL